MLFLGKEFKNMAKNKEIKTNAMRILDSLKISYGTYFYECDEFIDALKIADLLELPYYRVYKTLVTRAASKNIYVFVIPIDKELDLKKAAKVVSEKSIEMISVKEINGITGYIRGGCTAIGMKKKYMTHIDASAQELEQMVVSGGKIGVQLELAPADLLCACGGEFAELTI